MKSAFCAIVAFLVGVGICSTLQADEYTHTALAFDATGLSLKPGGHYSETVDKGVVKPACSGISIESLTLGTKEIRLKSTEITPDCMIETEGYGNLRFALNMDTYAYSIFTTPKQEEALKKLTEK